MNKQQAVMQKSYNNRAFDTFYDREIYIYGREYRLRTQRRARAKRKRILTAAAFLCVVLTLGCFLTGFSSPVKATVPSYKYYTAVTVQCNDTLWDIARRTMGEGYDSVHDYIRDIKDVNDMKNDAVYYGQKLILPYYSYLLK